MTEEGPAEGGRFDDLVPPWMFAVTSPVGGVVLAVAVTLVAAIPLLLADPGDDLRVGPLLGVAVVVVAALAGWWAAAISGVLALVLYGTLGLPPSGSLDLDETVSWVSFLGMGLLAVGVPALTRRVQRAVDDVRQLDAQRVASLAEQASLRKRAEATTDEVRAVVRMAAAVAAEHGGRAAVARAVLDGLELPDRPTTASVAIVEDRRLRILAAIGGAPEHVAALDGIDLSGSAWLAEVLDGTASYVDDREVFAVEHPDEGVLSLYPSGSWAAIPFRAGGDVGLLSLHHRTAQRLSACDLYYSLVAEVLAAGLERAQIEELQQLQLAELQQSLAERDRIARTLSTTLLPPALPRVDGLSVAAWLIPGTADEVAGDFYDLFTPASGGWVAVLGDVCGKGAEAAAVTSLARYAARVASLDEPEPAHVADVANQALLEDRSELFCTMAIVRGDPVDGHLDVALAGHLQPRLVTPSGVQRIGSFGTALGLARRTPDQERVAFAPGDLVVVFSDGLVERDPAYGEAELDADLAAWAGLSADAIAQALRERVESTEPQRPDDVAVLVLGRVAADRAGPIVTSGDLR